MAEIILSKAILFDKGYVLQTLSNLSSSILYYLKIESNNNVYDRTYVPLYNLNTILDLWETISIPQGSNVCFTLTDIPDTCETPVCDFTITQ